MDLSLLKTHLGDELYSQVEEKLGSLSGFMVIPTNDGSWLPKSKLDNEIEKRKALQTTVNSLTEELNESKKTIANGAELQSKVDQLTKDLQERDATITGMKRSSKIHDIIVKSNVRDASVVEKLLDATKITEDDKGNLSGVEEQIEALRKNSAYLFSDSHSGRGGFGDGQHFGGSGEHPGDSGAVNNAIRAAAGRHV